MDCTDLKYPNGFFDIVIDRSIRWIWFLINLLGTIDALLCGTDPDLSVAKMTKVLY